MGAVAQRLERPCPRSGRVPERRTRGARRRRARTSRRRAGWRTSERLPGSGPRPSGSTPAAAGGMEPPFPVHNFLLGAGRLGLTQLAQPRPAAGDRRAARGLTPELGRRYWQPEPRLRVHTRGGLIWRLVCQVGVVDRVRLAGWCWRVGRWVGAPGAVLGVASLRCEGWVPQRPGLLLPASALSERAWPPVGGAHRPFARAGRLWPGAPADRPGRLSAGVRGCQLASVAPIRGVRL